jgi:hypothetical protein
MLHLRVVWQRGFLVGGTRTHALLHLRCAFSAPFLQARHLAVLRFHEPGQRRPPGPRHSRAWKRNARWVAGGVYHLL